MKIEEYRQIYLSSKKDFMHAKRVSDFAKEIFKKLCPHFEELKEVEDKFFLLEYACELHDIGMHSKSSDPLIEEKHNKIGQKIVLENGIEGLNKEETAVVSALIRYHRGKAPSDEHKDFLKLNKDSKRLVEIFAAILRLADVLDFAHAELIESFELKFNDNEMILTPLGPMDIMVKMGFLSAWSKKKKLIEKVLDTKVVLDI